MPDYRATTNGLLAPLPWPVPVRNEDDGYVRVGLSERLADLELAAEDVGWLREAAWNDRDFSREGLKRILRLARLSYLKNPLIQRGVQVQGYYVFGMGCTMRSAHDDVNAVIQAFLLDPVNQAELTSHEAQIAKDAELAVSGNLFFCFFTRPASGKVRVRSLPVDEILAILTDPEDAQSPRFYKREHVRSELDTLTGAERQTLVIDYYPDWRYHPSDRPPTIGNALVHWDVPVFHVRTGGLRDMRFGVPEVYAALDWARAVKSDLEDYATTKRALSRFAWNLTTKGGAKGVAAAKSKFTTTLGNGDAFTETNPPPLVGSTFISGESTQMTPIRTAGSQPSTDDGRRLWLMVASAMGLPETFFGEASIGSHATAKTLDRPTELRMESRRTLWRGIFTAILEFVVEANALAPGGSLQGSADVDADGERVVSLGVDADGQEILSQIEVDFPPMLERDALQRVGAVVQAATLGGFGSAGTFDKRTVVQLLLQALGESDIDDLLDRLAPTDGEPLLPPGGVEVGPPKTPSHPAVNKINPNPPDDTGTDSQEAFVEALRELRAAVKTLG